MPASYTISDLKINLGNAQVSVVELGTSDSRTVEASELDTIFAPDSVVTPNGHNNSYTLYLNNSPVVITPIPKPSFESMPWTSQDNSVK